MDVSVLQERLDRIEAPRIQAERDAELARLQAKAQGARVRLVELAGMMAKLKVESAAWDSKIAHALAEYDGLRCSKARDEVLLTKLEREQGLCWQAIRGAEQAGRPVAAPVVERRPSTVADVRDAVLGWFRRLRDREALPAPSMRPDQYLAARVRVTSSCVAGGEGRPVGWVGLVPDSEVDVLVGNGRCVVLERRIVATRPVPAVAMARATRAARGPAGESLAAGDTIPVDATTRDAIREGRLAAFELIGDDVDAERRLADLERRERELTARFPQAAD